MRQFDFINNVTTTFAVIGLSLSMSGSLNTTPIVQKDNLGLQTYNVKDNINLGNINMSYPNKNEFTNENNYYVDKLTPLEKESYELFGVMRDASKEEIEATKKYVEEISTPTGVSFFD